MFDNYVVAKKSKRRTWKTVLISVSVVLHVVAVLALLMIRGFWVIEKLAQPKGDVAIATAATPPPPPPPPKASKKKKKPKTDKKVVKKIKPREMTQPIDKPVDEPDVEIEVVDEDEGVEGGVEGGVAGGILGGVVGGMEGLPGGKLEEPPPPPPPPAKPKIVSPQVLKGQRIAGEDRIEPDETTKMKLQRDGHSQIVTTVKICLAANGSVSKLSVLKSSGYPSYDRKIQAKMRQWRYKPYTVNGKPTPACSTVTFIYRQT